MSPHDLKAENAKLAAEPDVGLKVEELTEEDVISAILYPAVGRDYRKHVNKYSDMACWLPTPAYIYGMEVGEESALSKARNRVQFDA